MIENLLTEALCKKIEEAVKEFRLPVQNGEMRAPKIINGYLPPKRSRVDDDFPYVVVRAESGVCDRGESSVTVALLIGCYSKDDDGHEYCLNVMSRIRTALMSLENETLDKKYILQLPIKWDLAPVQPVDQWQLDMVTTWVNKTPQPIF